MKEIQLSQGKVALVDDEDYEAMSKISWRFARQRTGKFYACSSHYVCGKRKFIWMHRLILNTKNGLDTDHINGDGLDNRRCNLRAVTRAQNSWNKKHCRDSITGLKGVGVVGQKSKAKTKYMAVIMANGNRHYLGLFPTAELAHKAYCEAAQKLHGEFSPYSVS